MKNITVIGAGTMGNGIAHVMSQFDYQVTLYDISTSALEKAISTISANLDRQIKKNTLSESDKSIILSNIKTTSDLTEAAHNADLVIEAIVENLEIKQKLFKELDQLCSPNCILASNTSSISITSLANVTNRKDKVIGMHFMNPVPIMTLVEVIKGHQTSSDTTQIIKTITGHIQKTPIEVNDYPGFISNRLLMPLINEAIYAYYEGVAEIAAIDEIMKLGMAHPMGPLQLADFIGLDVCLYIMNVLYDGFKNPKYAPCPLLVKMVNAGELGKKTKKGFYSYD